jgi:GNAT superfamily N-acetyltransferase
MIRFIPVEDTLVMRNEILREGKLTLDECRFPTDKIEGAFHLGYFEDKQLLCIVSFHPQLYGEYNGVGYQLRGMATLEKYRGKGIGNQLVNFAIVYLRVLNVNYLWCNARVKAVRFYLNIGFEVISDQFEIPVTGPHHVLYLKIQ